MFTRQEFFPLPMAFGLFRLMVLVILSHLPYFSRKLYRDFVNRRFDDINFFLRKKDLGFGLYWVMG